MRTLTDHIVSGDNNNANDLSRNYEFDEYPVFTDAADHFSQAISNHTWSLAQEQQFIRDVIAAFQSATNWGNHVRERHGSVNNFLRSYIVALDRRVRSFGANGREELLLESERDFMKIFCRRMMIEELRPAIERTEMPLPSSGIM